VGRLQHSIDSIRSIAEIIELPIEYILVEWNPPADLPLLSNLVRWQAYESAARVIVVPKAVHDSIPNPHGQRFFEWRAKNVGIRRAQGKFIACINGDVVPSLDLMITLRGLQEDSFYRVNRHDIMEMGGATFRIKRASGDFAPGEDYTQSKTGVPYHPDMLHFNSSGDFLCMSREWWHKLRGYPETDYDGSVDGEMCWIAHQAGLKQVVLEEPLFHLEHPHDGVRNDFVPGWSDATPHGTMNPTDDWGIPELESETGGHGVIPEHPHRF
jgi:hypothetical protein